LVDVNGRKPALKGVQRQDLGTKSVTPGLVALVLAALMIPKAVWHAMADITVTGWIRIEDFTMRLSHQAAPLSK
jgi:hypothetical protein